MLSRLLTFISAALAVSCAAAGVVERQIIILGETTLHAWHAGVDLGPVYVSGTTASLVGAGPGTTFYINDTDTRLYAGLPTDTLPIILPPHAVLTFPSSVAGSCGTTGPVLFTRASAATAAPACEVSTGFSFSGAFLDAPITGTFLVCGTDQQIEFTKLLPPGGLSGCSVVALKKPPTVSGP